MIDALVELEGDGEIYRIPAARDQPQRARSRLDHAVAATAVLVLPVLFEDEASLLRMRASVTCKIVQNKKTAPAWLADLSL